MHQRVHSGHCHWQWHFMAVTGKGFSLRESDKARKVCSHGSSCHCRFWMRLLEPMLWSCLRMKPTSGRGQGQENHIEKKFSTLKNYYTKNPTCPLHSCSLGQSEQSFRFVCAQSPSYVQLFATLWIAAHQAPLSMGFPRQECWNRLPCSHPGDLPDPGICYSQSKTSLIPSPHFPGHCTFDSQPKFSLEIIISIF